ncbi:hypothetical protein RJ53_08310 [Methanocalculus chunghsingensis]|uniref:Uncharacterized protein n=2 Tax=Methanocalculus chunghsingensis TaxID=156457 RepID=A0A8J8B5U3_9EURY|nr:hypothetical protein [Methanocalculus chunghsingensis]
MGSEPITSPTLLYPEGANTPFMSRITINNGDSTPGSGVEGKKTKKDEKIEIKDATRKKEFGKLRFDGKNQSDIFESKPR